MKGLTKVMLVAIIAIMGCVVTASAATPKEKCVQKLEKLTQEMKKNSADYTDEDWEDVAIQYEAIAKEMEEYSYTDEELRKIGVLKGRFYSMVAKKNVNKGASELNTLIQQLGGFLQGFLEKDE
ncbi:MAG: hypothetical protein J5698_05585 [Bacteroidaceae bacterium]|nr:hypothetical protein [Bacteroidaceae bacterium]MBO4590424.1 hypothetical protein [Bacteroidaceae bacterium]MBR5962974.1 hypothetical protein [Bacteroidaceae bacterium]